MWVNSTQQNMRKYEVRGTKYEVLNSGAAAPREIFSEPHLLPAVPERHCITTVAGYVAVLYPKNRRKRLAFATSPARRSRA